MKKISLLVILCTLFTFCKSKDSDDIVVPSKAKNTITDSIPTNEKDEDGCLASAGYIWSKVNEECVKVYSGIQLNPKNNLANEDESLSAFVLFSENKKEAEVFLPSSDSSIVLKATSKSNEYVLEDWKLTTSNNFILSKNNQELFIGDGQIGKKISGRDTE